MRPSLYRELFKEAAFLEKHCASESIATACRTVANTNDFQWASGEDAGGKIQKTFARSPFTFVPGIQPKGPGRSDRRNFIPRSGDFHPRAGS